MERNKLFCFFPICRIYRDRSFHCDVCNVCLDKRLEGKHKCRPDSGHDECCICLEVTVRSRLCNFIHLQEAMIFLSGKGGKVTRETCPHKAVK